MEHYIKETCKHLTDYVWVVYVLRSHTNPNLMYVGCTNNIQRRLRQHNGLIKGGGKYTSANRPWALALIVPVKDKSDALKVEYWAKAKNYSSQSGIPRTDPVTRRKYLIHKSMQMHGYTNIIYFDSSFYSKLKGTNY